MILVHLSSVSALAPISLKREVWAVMSKSNTLKFIKTMILISMLSAGLYLIIHQSLAFASEPVAHAYSISSP